MMSERSVDWNNRAAFDAVWTRLDSASREQMQARLQTFLAEDQSSQAKQIANEFLNRPLIDPIAAAVQQLSVETDPETIRSLYHQVTFSNYQRQREGLYAAIMNPNSPVDLCASELGWASTEQLTFLVGRSDFTYEVAASLLNNHGGNDLFAVCADKFDPKELARAICVGDTPPYWLLNTAVIAMNPELMLELYPIEIVLREGSTASLARNMIVEHLGADDQRWEMFARLMPEWTSNLASLLNAVDQLS
jgi:hypothetical protein